ncbi:PUR family DNA/RNA-binding protein [Treponema sp.]|uniref:PUR family DNA/RNA-binding protein n=1 Tax=Treponema sp. TaxID=166 RepID=UPI00298DDC42|nr:PUR family DNA/RNA-binding protein [Treponema sp.]MCR5614422.1 PUR family DNA/RNA-binding protein [Treponema sp.]
MGIRGELFTTQITLDNRAYFFNVKENRAGDVFLQVVESKKGDGADFDRHQIAVFAEDMQKFLKGLDQSLSFIEKDKKERAKKAAEKKAAKEAKYGKGSETKKVYRKSSKADGEQEHLYTPQLKKTGRVHVVSKRKTDK